MIRLFLVIFLLTLFNNEIKSQKPSNEVNVKKVNVEGFKYGDPISKCKEVFGKPKEYKEVDQSGGLYPEGRDKLFFLNYDSLKVIYYEFQNEKYLDNIIIKSRKYEVSIGDVNISVGDNIDILKKAFSTSYQTYKEQYNKPYENKTQQFYIDLRVKHPEYVAYGIINVFLENDIIKQIILGFGDSA